MVDPQSGDFVVIEFGHNDGGSLTPKDNGRSDCTPVNNNYATTCSTTYNGAAETVQTYYTYLVNAAKLFKTKGATVIISSATPNNVWETGTFTYSANRFVTYASDAAKAAGATFVDHGLYTAHAYKNAGATTVSGISLGHLSSSRQRRYGR
jgi:rhamnogalacturonan acetylesterase